MQFVLGLIVTPEGIPLAYEVLAGSQPRRKKERAMRRRLEQELFEPGAVGDL